MPCRLFRGMPQGLADDREGDVLTISVRRPTVAHRVRGKAHRCRERGADLLQRAIVRTEQRLVLFVSHVATGRQDGEKIARTLRNVLTDQPRIAEVIPIRISLPVFFRR